MVVMSRRTCLLAAVCLVSSWACSGDGDSGGSSAGSSSAGSGGSEADGHAGSTSAGANANAGRTGTGSAGNTAGTDATGGNSGRDNAGSSGFDPGDRCGPVARMPRCIAGGWCWEAPLPMGGNLNAIDGPQDGSSLFAVGAQGSAFRWCEQHWVPIDTGVDVELTSVWHPSKDLAIAVGDAGTVLRWDGHTWTKLTPPTDRKLNAVWGLGPDQIWIGSNYDADGSPLLFELHGDQLTRATLPKPFLNGNDINAISGRSPELFVGGGSLGVMDSWYFDGSQWSYNQTSVDGILRELRSYPDGTTLALVPGINDDVVYHWTGAGQMPGTGWQPGYGKGDYATLVSLFTDVHGKPAVVEDTHDFALPGKAVSFDGMKWADSEERFTALPSAIWNGADGGFAVGDETALLARGKNGIWAQHVDVLGISGKPLFLGGASEQTLTLVTEHEIDRRGASGWTRLEREDDLLYQRATIDEQGRVYVLAQSQYAGQWDTIKYYDDADGWHELPKVDSAYSLLANAPDDVWIGDGSSNVRHFDGTAWVDAYDLCKSSTVSNPIRFRRAPDGKVWLLNDHGTVEIDLESGKCTPYLAPGTLQDMVWLGNGDVWAISTWGELYKLTGTAWALNTDLIPENASEYVGELLAGPGNDLRVAIRSEYELDASFKLVTIDVSGDVATLKEPTALPGHGLFWTSGDVVYEALAGGVLRRQGD